MLAETHNPSILHPAFLAAQGIVPSEWKVAEPPICTPAMSVVRYSNGIVFTVDVGKFQVLDGAPKRESSLPELAIRYLDRLPHVHYMAVGVNIAGFVDCRDPEKWSLNRFIREGPWNNMHMVPESAEIKLSYQLVPAAVLNLSVKPALIEPPHLKSTEKGLLVDANYHAGVSPGRGVEDAKQAIGKFAERFDDFGRITQLVLDLNQ